MPDTNPARALDVARRVEMMCDFIEHTGIKNAVEQHVPVPMRRAPGALGFDIPLWVGLGLVGLWSALDGFSERACLPRRKCKTCRRYCMPVRFAAPYILGNDGVSLEELEDLRHLYAHNYAGLADDVYFRSSRHVLAREVPVQLSSGGSFDGRRPGLGLAHLREYSAIVRRVLGRFS